MKDINCVTLTGRLTYDPELKTSSIGNDYLKFRIAVNDVKRHDDGTWEEIPNFFNCFLFGKRSEPLSKILHKGSPVSLDGRLRYRVYEYDGQKRNSVEIVVDTLIVNEKPNKTQQEQIIKPG